MSKHRRKDTPKIKQRIVVVVTFLQVDPQEAVRRGPVYQESKF
jgi:hypothetical protein